MKNFALGAFITLLVAAAALQALAQSSDEQRGGGAPASADAPSAAADACKPDVITVRGRGKYRRSTLEKELGGAGSAMADAVGAWEKETGAKFGEGWKAWSRATERSLECAHGVVINDSIICTISGRPCESDPATATADKGDPGPPPLAKIGPPAPAAQSDEEQVGSDAPRCYGVIAAVGKLATSTGKALRVAEETWMDRIMFDFGERYVDLNFAQEASHVCAVAVPVSPAVIIKKVYFRCKIWARPCRPPDAQSASATKAEAEPSTKSEPGR